MKCFSPSSDWTISSSQCTQCLEWTLIGWSEREETRRGRCQLHIWSCWAKEARNKHTLWHTVSSFNTQTESWTLRSTHAWVYLLKSKLLYVYMHVRGLYFCLILIFKMFTMSLTVLTWFWRSSWILTDIAWKSGHHSKIIIRPSFLIPNIKPLWIIKWC